MKIKQSSFFFSGIEMVDKLASKNLAQTCLSIAVVMALTAIACRSSATTLEPLNIKNNDVVINVTDGLLNINSTTQRQPPIYFTGSGKLTINFLNPGTLEINQSAWPESYIFPQQGSPLNLEVNNGSVVLDIANGAFNYFMGGAIDATWGSKIFVDHDLVIDFDDESEYCNYYTLDGYWAGNEALRTEGTNVTVGGNLDISINRKTWKKLNAGTNSRFGSLLAGILASNSRDDDPEEVQSPNVLNFGANSPDKTTFRILDINSGVNTGSAVAYGVWVSTHLNETIVHGQGIIEDIHAFTHSDGEEFTSQAIGAYVVGGKLRFLNSLTIKNISAIADNSVGYDELVAHKTGARGDIAEALAIRVENGGLFEAVSEGSTVQIENDLAAGSDGTIRLNFSNEQSHFFGTALQLYTEADGHIQLAFADNANWRLSKSNTHPVDLTLDNAAVYLNQTSDGNIKELTKENANTLTLSSLEGSNATFHLSTAVNQAYGDSIHIASGSGSFGLMLQGTGEEPIEAALNRALVRDEGGNIGFSLANNGGVVDLGNYVYGLTNRTYEKAKEWFLTNQTPDNPDPEDPDNPNVPVDPDEPGGETEGEGGHPVLSPSATAVLALAGSGAQTSQFLYGLSDIRKRMGDVRQKAADGLYAMARGGKNRISGFASTSFKDEYGALSIGFDRKFSSNWIAGAVFEAIEGDQTVRSNGYKAEGESSTQALKGYLSWFGEKGSFADVVFGVSYFDQDINTKMLDGTGVSGGFSGWGWGASVEAGHQFLMNTDPTWFIEPQVQLSYFRVQGDSFALTNGMRVDQEDADSLTGRLGLVVGRTILADSGSGWQFSIKGGLAHEFLEEADIRVNGERFTGSTLGTRGYYGVAFDWYASDAVRVFGQIEREEGEHYTSEINARIGVKYCF